MRRVLQKICPLLILFTLVFIASTNAYANLDSKENEYLKDHAKIMNAMKEEFKSSHNFGDVTADFLEEMIIHNQGAIYMSENVLKYGSNKKVREISKSVIRNQIDAITEMSAVLDIMEDNLKIDKEKENEYLKNHEEIIKSMISDMERIECTEDVDKHYLKSMNLHQEANIKIVRNISNYTKDKTVKKIVDKGLKNSTKQIEKIKKIINLKE